MSAGRALLLHSDSAPALPEVPAFSALYAKGLAPKRGDVVMVAGRSGSQKSGFTLYWVRKLGLPTLYFAADMKPIEAATRLASIEVGETSTTVRSRIKAAGAEQYGEALRGSNVHFSFGSPITWERIDLTMQGWVELYGTYPEVIVLDNLMDFAGGEADYQAQMETMQRIDEMAQETKATVIVLHHQTSKGASSEDPGIPAPISSVKNGLSEKPQIVLGVALGVQMVPHELRVAILKQREGASDPSGRDYARIGADPARTTFFSLESEYYGGS